METDSLTTSTRAWLTLLVLVAVACIAGAVGGHVVASMFASSWADDGPTPKPLRHKPSSEVTSVERVLTSAELGASAAQADEFRDN